MLCIKCGAVEGEITRIYPYAYKNKPANTICLCEMCKILLRTIQGKIRYMHNQAQNDVFCLCCEPYKMEYDSAVSDLSKFFDGMNLTKNQRKYT